MRQSERHKRASEYRKAYSGVLLVILIAAAAALSLFRIVNWDVWWQMKTGELIIAEKSIPYRDVFSHTMKGEYYPPMEWLFDLIAYLASNAGGLTAVIILKVIIVAAMAFFLFLTCLRSSGSPLVSFAGTALLLTAMRFRLTMRPHVFTFLFLVLYQFIILKPAKGFSNRRIILMASITLLWVNIHPGVVHGLVYLVLFITGLLFDSMMEKYSSLSGRHQNPALKHLLIVLIVCLAVSFINPNFFAFWNYAFKHAAYQSIVDEFKAPAFNEHPLFFILMAISFLLIIPTIRSTGFRRILPAVPFVAASLFFARMIPLALLLTLPAAVDSFVLLLKKSQRLKLIPGKYAFLIMVVLAAVLAAGLHLQFRSPLFFNFKPGFGFDRTLFPFRAVEFLNQTGIKGTLLNDNRFGGFIIYYSSPLRPVFSDGRQTLYHELHKEILDINRKSHSKNEFFQAWRRLLEKYGVDYAVTSYGAGGLSGLNAFLISDAQWSLIWFDDVAQIYLKKTSSFYNIMKDRIYHELDPNGIRRNYEVETAMEEARRNIKEVPDSPIGYYILSRLHYASGQYEQALNFADEAVERSVKNPGAYYLKYQILRSIGETRQAAEALKQAVKLNPQNAHFKSELRLLRMQELN